MTETTNYNYVTRSETNSTQPIIERLRYRSSVSTVVQAVDEAASLIERQQKAIDLLLDALDNLQVQGVNNGSWVMIPSVELDSIFRAIRSLKNTSSVDNREG